MIITKSYQSKNRAYKAATAIIPRGIVVHSTGANNPWIKRYVDDVTNYGKNVYGNTKNRATATSIAHAYLGKDKDGNTDKVAQTLPFNIACWGCGKGKKGSYNYDPTARIQFEICEDNLKDEKYFNAVFKTAIEFCAYLCETYNLKVSTIVSHKEAHDLGYASNHGDPHAWLKNFGKDMNWFRNEVQKVLDKNKEEPVVESKYTTPKNLSKAQKVTALQNAIKKDGIHKKCGYTDSQFKVDGIWGAMTEKCVKAAEVKKNSKYSNCNKLFQEYLNKCGFDCGKADGIVGSKTVAAIKSYKKYCGFKSSLDVAGLKTWQKMCGM